MAVRRVLAAALTLVAACSGGGDDGPRATDAAVDAALDAPTDGPPCVPGETGCTNCLDDDADGTTDGWDIECAGPWDDAEDHFGFGIPGLDGTRDCFFDGNSGAGDDGCLRHPCCELGAPDMASCGFDPASFDPAACDDPQAPRCLTSCEAVTPPGCDCFGCCTLCFGADPAICEDIFINPLVSPSCDASTLEDPQACPRCTKAPDCASLCVPTGQPPCGPDAPCAAGQYCARGCCIAAELVPAI